jgi:hypothetical protein
MKFAPALASTGPLLFACPGAIASERRLTSGERNQLYLLLRVAA